MPVVNLPHDIDPDKKPESIVFHNYLASFNSLKGKSILHTNAISLVITGEKTMHFADKTVHIKDDEFHFLSSGNCLASVSISPLKKFRSILLFFDSKVLTDFYVKYHAKVSPIKASQKFTPKPYIAFKKDEFVLHFIQSLQLLFASGNPISTEMKLLKFEELMLHLLENYPEKLLAFQNDKNHTLSDFEIRKAVETNIVNNMSIEELAFLCNTSLSTFKRRFTQIYGTSPKKWMLQKRIDLAKDLLHNEHIKPSDVFHQIGYENHSSFSESFKQNVGLTPKEFQEQLLNV
ncbi:MAG: AraC family transcriptional regulator [Bacteroidota bacterium]